MYSEQFYPFSHELFRRLNQFLSTTMSGENETPFSSLSSGELVTNVREDEEAFYVEMEVPGVKPENVDVTMIGAELSIKIERTEPQNNDQKRFLRRERRFGNIRRTITLPLDSPSKEIDASMDQGILCIRLKKPEEAKVQKISVNTKS